METVNVLITKVTASGQIFTNRISMEHSPEHGIDIEEAASICNLQKGIDRGMRVEYLYNGRWIEQSMYWAGMWDASTKVRSVQGNRTVSKNNAANSR